MSSINKMAPIGGKGTRKRMAETPPPPPTNLESVQDARRLIIMSRAVKGGTVVSNSKKCKTAVVGNSSQVEESASPTPSAHHTSQSRKTGSPTPRATSPPRSLNELASLRATTTTSRASSSKSLPKAAYKDKGKAKTSRHGTQVSVKQTITGGAGSNNFTFNF